MRRRRRRSPRRTRDLLLRAGGAALVLGLLLLVVGSVRVYAGVDVGGTNRGTATDRVSAPFTDFVFGGMLAVIGGAVVTSVRTERRRRDDAPPRGRGGLPLA